jgi:hypothetical protein
MTGGFFHGKGLQKGIIVISNPTSLLDRRDLVVRAIIEGYTNPQHLHMS